MGGLNAVEKLSLRTAGNIAIQDSYDYFIRKCKVKNLSENTIGVYRDHLQEFMCFLTGQGYLTVEGITLKTIEDFFFYLREGHACKDITINTYLRDVRVFMYFCMDEGYIQRFKIKLMKIDKEIKKTYTDSELESLLKKPNIKTCDFSEYKIWAFSNYLLATGNRISTVLSLKIGDLDFDSGMIGLMKVKNRKAQIIPMSAALSNVLKEYLIYRKGDKDDYLFCNNYGGKGDMRTYQEMLAEYNKKRGVNKTSAHLYRHTFAKKWIFNGGDVFRLQKILGHSDLSMVREYVNIFGNDIAVDFDKFNPLDNMAATRSKEKIKL
jgi:integrase/recombinase XerD